MKAMILSVKIMLTAYIDLFIHWYTLCHLNFGILFLYNINYSYLTINFNENTLQYPNCVHFILNQDSRGAWLVQLEEQVTLDLRVKSLSAKECRDYLNKFLKLKEKTSR